MFFTKLEVKLNKVRKFLPFCLVCLFFIPSPFLNLSSGDDNFLFTREWGNLGLYGGQIYDIEIDDADPSRIFAGAYYGDGLFQSTNGGGSRAVSFRLAG